ncbi:LamG-like jellyroll fold domain-containing protein [Micromonosporaceae bacterium Da 78-11]
MRSRRMWIVTLAASTTLGGTTVLLGPGSTALAAADRAVALWDMNETTGATTMRDSSGHGIDGRIGSEVGVGAEESGSQGYRFDRLEPDTPPAHPQHLIMVADNDGLNPGERDFAVTVRLRTIHKFGNVIQKGQATVPGGNWKIQIPNGRPQCVFRGAKGTMLASAPKALNDGAWHTITCLNSGSGLTLSVDGTTVAGRSGRTGRIANSWPLSIGGKSSCDQSDVGCDYFAGDIDYVRIDAGEQSPGGSSSGGPSSGGQNSGGQNSGGHNSGGNGSDGDGPDPDDSGWDWDDSGWDWPDWGDFGGW